MKVRGGRGDLFSPQAHEEFLTWYGLYPRHKAPVEAEKAFHKARETVSFERIIAGTERAIAGWRKEGRKPKYIPYPATWLNGGSYDDDDIVSIGQPGLDLDEVMGLK